MNPAMKDMGAVAIKAGDLRAHFVRSGGAVGFLAEIHHEARIERHAAAVGVAHFDPLRFVPLDPHRQLGRGRAAPARVHGRVLEQEQDVADLATLAALAQPTLQLVGLLVGDEAAVHDVDRLAHVDNLLNSGP